MRRHRFAVHPVVDAVVDAVLECGAAVYRRPDVRAWAGLPDGWPPPGRGLPIGALTSQLFAAHVYLDALDHHVKRVLKVPGYVRYVDDLLLFGDRRADLRDWRGAVGRFLQEERALRLKYPEARLLSCHGHIDALGYRVRRDEHEALPRTLRRMKNRVTADLLRPPGSRPTVDIRRSAAASAGVVLF